MCFSVMEIHICNVRYPLWMFDIQDMCYIVVRRLTWLMVCKNLVTHVAYNIVSWPHPKRRLTSHIYDSTMIRINCKYSYEHHNRIARNYIYRHTRTYMQMLQMPEKLSGKLLKYRCHIVLTHIVNRLTMLRTRFSNDVSNRFLCAISHSQLYIKYAYRTLDWWCT